VKTKLKKLCRFAGTLFHCFYLEAVVKKVIQKKEFEFALKIIKEIKYYCLTLRMNKTESKIPYSQLEKIQYVYLFRDCKVGFEKLLQAIKKEDNLVGGHHFGEKNFG
jgi:hypothetical protein